MIKTFKDHEHLRAALKVLPDKPGVYQYFDSNDTIIYIGKAKSLKKRVSSYFHKEKFDSGKVAVLVRKVARIEHIVVASETDALLLENNLVKKHQPKYNIQLKDDKTFPWIIIKNEPYPRVFSTRTVIRDGSEYFGPYASVRLMNNLLELIRQLYQLRNCKLNLSQENIQKGKYKVCLEYHIKRCKGPCVGLQDEIEYQDTIQEIREIIKGNISTVIKQLKELMSDYAEKMEFEKAQSVKDRIDLLEKFQSKSLVVNPKIRDVDVFAYDRDDSLSYVNYLKIVNGAIVQSHTLELKPKLDETDEEILSFAVVDTRERFNSLAPEIVLPFNISYDKEDVKQNIPKIGDKKKLLELSEQNLKYFILEKKKKEELVDPERHTKRIMEQMKTDLRMKSHPTHIECFDNSNIQGDFPVAACVVFRNGKPFKKDYRHFNIKTVEGPDDFESMREIIYRRYDRLMKEKKELPQLIIIDGGKGQLSAAVDSLERLGLRGTITIIGIAKKLEEIYYPDDPYPLHLDKRSETLKIIQHARNEAHRFGITHHRNKRDKDLTKTVLTEIEGIGFNTAQKLLWKFKSVDKVKKASEEEISEVIGKAKAKVVYQHFHKTGKNI